MNALTLRTCVKTAQRVRTLTGDTTARAQTRTLATGVLTVMTCIWTISRIADDWFFSHRLFIYNTHYNDQLMWIKFIILVLKASFLRIYKLCFTADVDECTFYQQCFNGGSCVNTPGSFHCDCSASWTGANCTEGDINLPKHSSTLNIHVRHRPVVRNFYSVLIHRPDHMWMLHAKITFFGFFSLHSP